MQSEADRKPNQGATDSSAGHTPSNAIKPPSLSLPKGGGAIKGIGEKFGANPVTGTGSMTVPIATSPGRSGFGPQLSLSYDSGAGNGPFGFGWSLSTPSITRKTDKGLPRYEDGRGETAQDSDVFVLSGAEDLVPVLRESTGDPRIHDELLDGFHVRRYRPRIEGLFARIERWTSTADAADVHWRSYSKDNILTLYGRSAESRIADPENPRRIFSWLICETRDDKGNALLYRYKAEDGAGVEQAHAHQRNRGEPDSPLRGANRYLKRIHYGNRTSALDAAGKRPRDLDAERIADQLAAGDWMFEVVFDYGDHDAEAPTPQVSRVWAHRPDAFSNYRPGFEVRTTRTCQRVLMFHHFEGEAGVGRDCLVRSTDFTYSDELDPQSALNPVYTFLKSVTQTGWRRHGSGYVRRSVPPVEFVYSQPVIQSEVHAVEAESLIGLPSGLANSSTRWEDLHGEGIPGLLTEQGGAWFYKRNLSPLDDGSVRFGPPERVALKPNLSLQAGAQFMDLAGEGQPDLVLLDGPAPGFYEHDDAEGWQPYRPFTSLPNLDWRNPNLRFVDLDGDGHADILITEGDTLVWYPSLAEAGFGPARRLVQQLDEEKAPRVVFTNDNELVALADLNGDGLVDLLRVRHAEVCYWPNLGHGRFGAKVTMDGGDSPFLLDSPDQFNPRHLRLADIDGSGSTDLIYLRADGVQIRFNQCGNAWGPARRLAVFPRVDDLVHIEVQDLLANGTACLVWSSPLPGDGGQPMRYVDLMGGSKPHLLVRSVNNLGAETVVRYASSARFYLQDRQRGTPWITRLPFPVHVVDSVETRDRIGRNRFVTRYEYHHGYFDGEEREFRGFGRVDQWDGEEISALDHQGADLDWDNTHPAYSLPPVRTTTWFHTGAWLGRDLISLHFQHEYWQGDPAAARWLLDDTILPTGLSLEEEREACRALKGAMLRQEVYAEDGTDKAGLPYSVVEQNFTITPLQPRGGNRHAVFFTHAREALTHHHERNPADPRTQHALTLEVDAWGNVLKSLAVGYGRRPAQCDLSEPADRDKQTRALMTFSEQQVTNAIDSAADYRAPLPASARTWELTGFHTEAAEGRLDFALWAANHAARATSAAEIPYEAEADRITLQRRLVEHSRTRYRADDCSRLLADGQLEPLALPGESWALAFTPGLLLQTYVRNGTALLPDPAAILAGQGGGQGGYVDLDQDGHWWVPSGRIHFNPVPGTDPTLAAAEEAAWARSHFYLPHRYVDPFGHATTLRYDEPHCLTVVETRDALGNCVSAGERDTEDRLITPAIDYCLLQPWLVTDPNRNRSAVAFDTLGMVVATAVMGKREEHLGDLLSGFEVDLDDDALQAYLASPLADPHALIGNASTRLVYDLFAYQRTQHLPTPQGATVAALARETHIGDLKSGQLSKIQHAFSYSDGFGREIQKKIRAEPGPLDLNDKASPIVDPRWVGSGWTLFNNKGKPVRQYEPFFSATHAFEFGVTVGVSPVLFYDPVGRVVATLHPNHTYDKVVFNPWKQTTWDVNDTCAPRESPTGEPRLAVTGDPRNDADTGHLMARYFAALPADEAQGWQTWYQQRIGNALGIDEGNAARRAAAHAGTPSIAHLDALGRPFMTLAHHRVVCNDHPLDGNEESFATRVDLDIEGSQLAVRDERRLPVDYEPTGPLEQRIVMRYRQDLLGRRIHQLSMEAGARWALADVAGQPLRAWDSRGHGFRSVYDALRRPVEQWVRGEFSDPDPCQPNSDPRTLGHDTLVERIEYGDAVADAQAWNLRTRHWRHFDGAGVVINAGLDADGRPTQAYDFKGNLLRSTRRLATDYKGIPDWSQPADAQLDATEYFEGSTRYDALNRAIQQVAPHSSLTRPEHPNKFNITQPVFNEAGLLERLHVWLEQAREPGELLDPAVTAPSPVGVHNIDHDAKGQRLCIEYKNGVRTRYWYDPDTFRLVHLYTRRGLDFTEDCENPQPPPATTYAPDEPPLGRNCGLQNLHYTYDPAGNITHIQDAAQQTIYFSGARVEPSNDYTYDALYRLIEATGREHLGQGGATIPHSYNDAGRVGIVSSDASGRLAPNDANAMGNYAERYVYDAVGSILQMSHTRTNGPVSGWTRQYAYTKASWTEPGNVGNRLTSTIVGNATTETYAHDAHGNMMSMPHLSEMNWNYQDHLQLTRRQRVNDEDADGIAHEGDSNYYVYDFAGQRIRKVIEKGSSLTEEWIYVSAFESCRRRRGTFFESDISLEREMLNVMEGKQRIALVEILTVDAASAAPTALRRTKYHSGNHLGSAYLELDEKGQIVSYEEYTPYGCSSFHSVRSQSETPKRYRYTGIERDNESGFYYHGARYYAAWLTRWISCDPLWMVDSISLYTYTRNCPTTLSDPSGTQSIGINIPNQANHLLKQFSLPAKEGGSTGSSTSLFHGMREVKTTDSVWKWFGSAASSAWDWTKSAASTAWNWTKPKLGWTWNWILAPAMRTTTNTLLGAFAGGIPGAIGGTISGAVHGWQMADAGTYDWKKWSGWLQFVADNTWSLPNSALGSAWATLNIWNSKDLSKSKGTGQLVFQGSWHPDYATTFGNVTAGQQVPKHERTHALQARAVGPAFYPTMIAHYAICLIPYWLLYHDKMYPKAPIENFGQYFTRGVYPHTWAEEWAYSIEGAPQ